MRVSEGDGGNKQARKFLGRPSPQVCLEVVDAWLSRVAALRERMAALKKEGNDGVKLSAAESTKLMRDLLSASLAKCRDMAERLANRRVEIAWCSWWGYGQPGHPAPDVPDEIWTILDASLPEKESALARPLAEAFERHLSVDREKRQVEERLRAMGFSCNTRDDKFDATTSICSVNVNENFATQQQDQPVFLLVTRITVTVRFEREQSPSARQIEVTATRAML
jgi:hypothetical protein